MISQAILARVSQDIQDEFGDNVEQCRPISERSKELLAEHGISAQVVSGYAAFRVSRDIIIAYHPDACGVTPDPLHPCSEVCHCWLEVDGTILDFTTYSFGEYQHPADRKPGVRVAWPAYVRAGQENLSSYAEVVARGTKPGTVHYEARILEDGTPDGQAVGNFQQFAAQKKTGKPTA